MSQELSRVHKNWSQEDINYFFHNLEDITNEVSNNVKALEIYSLWMFNPALQHDQFVEQIEQEWISPEHFITYRAEYNKAFNALQDLLAKKHSYYDKHDIEPDWDDIDENVGNRAIRTLTKALIGGTNWGSRSNFDNNVLRLLPRDVAVNIAQARQNIWDRGVWRSVQPFPSSSFSFSSGGERKKQKSRHLFKYKRRRANRMTKRNRKKKSKRRRRF